MAFSSSRSGNAEYLETNLPVIKNFLGSKATNIAFIPFATADNKYEEYGLHVMDSLKDLPYKIEIAFPQTAKSLIENCDTIMVGGGNYARGAQLAGHGIGRHLAIGAEFLPESEE